MIIIEAISMGVFATLFMDVLASLLAKRRVIYSFIKSEALGRWFLYMLRGKFIHDDILKTPSLKNERIWCFASHYLIGIILAGIFLFLELKVQTIRDQLWMSIIYGMATVFFPWLWLLPSVGLGFMAAKSTKRLIIIRTNLINHTNFGLGLFLWIILFHRLFL